MGVTIKTLLWCYLNYIKNLQLYFMLKLLIEVFLKILSRSNLQISIQKFLLILGLSTFLVIPNVLVNVCCVKIHHKTLTWDENPQWDFWHPVYSIRSHVDPSLFSQGKEAETSYEAIYVYFAT